MSVDAVLAEIRQRKLFISNAYEGVDRLWHCFLREKRNVMPSVHRGSGNTMEAALRAALPAAEREPCMRYWYHAESDCYFITEDGRDDPADQGCDEFEEAEWRLLVAKQPLTAFEDLLG
ncbi:MAG: hypothetical protein E5V59_24680 [Mesorhizobium sp.]|nr:MAG: hypothetical protein E5V59_24680 [Mesorhizobium sp.]